MDMFIEGLKEQARVKRDEYATLTKERLRVESEISKLHQYIDELNPLLVRHGLDTIDLKAVAGSGFAKPGNRSEFMPDRKPEYEGASLALAVEPLLRNNGRMHANELVKAIYEIRNATGHKYAKRTLVGTLRGMMKKGDVVRVEPNTYELASATNGRRAEGVLTNQ